jgi:hypothetical protein
VIHALEYLGGDDSAARDAAEIEHRISGAVDLLQPGWRGLIVAKRFRPNMTVSFAAIPPVPASRPSIDAAGIRGLFLAGDWIGPTYLQADAAAESARSAAQAALQTLPALAAA